MFQKFLAAIATVALTVGLLIVATASASAEDTEATVAPVVSETAAIPPVAPDVDEVVDIALTFITGCAPDITNTWRVRNPSSAVVLVNYNNGGVHRAEPGDTSFETKRALGETMIISWGKDGSGVKPGRQVKASGSDRPITTPRCAIITPSATIAVTECVYDSNGKAAAREVLITFDNSKSNVPVAFNVPWFASFGRTIAAGETVTFRASTMRPSGGSYSVVANGQTFTLLSAGCTAPVKPPDEVVTVANPQTSFDCAAKMVNFTTTTYRTSYAFDAPTETWVQGKTVEGPMVPSKRAITADETVEHCAFVAPSASTVVTECVYNSDGKAALREVRITFDNRKSNIPVAFTVASFSSFSKIVAAGETLTFLASPISASGGGYVVFAGGETFDLLIADCVEPTKPADVAVTSVSLPTSFDCAAGQVNFTTTTTTRSFVFNTSRVTWIAGTTVVGPHVPSTRAFTQEETAEHCATAASETPRASSCSTTDDQSPYTRWIHLVLDPALDYSIANDQTGLQTVPTSNYVELAVGIYTVRVGAASGYLLSPGAIESWSLTVADSGSCTPSPSPTPTSTPTSIPTTGGSTTLPQGESTGGDDIVAASAASNPPTLDFALDGAAGGPGVNPAPGSRVDDVLKTQNPAFVNIGYAAIAALTVLLLCALILLVRRYRAAGDQ